jgi:hypothetical protein
VIIVDVLDYPVDEMIFECSFDSLVQQVGSEELMNVGAGKMGRERLKG